MSRSRSEADNGPRTSERVEALIGPLIAELGYELVLVEMISTPERPTMRVSIDRLDHAGQVSLEDCVRVNRLLEDRPDLDALMPGAYNLEVSSPGVNRPLVREKDFARFVGEKAQVTTREPLDGRRNFTGRIVSVNAGELCLDLGKVGRVAIQIQQIARANLKPDTADLFKRVNARAASEVMILEEAAGEEDTSLDGEPR